MDTNKPCESNKMSLINVVLSKLSHGYDQLSVSNWGWINEAIFKPTPSLLQISLLLLRLFQLEGTLQLSLNQVLGHL